MILYCAPHDIRRLLPELLTGLGSRRLTVCRELTKLHEEVTKTTLSAALAYYSEQAPRGEFVLVIAGASDGEADAQPSLEDVVQMAQARIKEGERASDVCRELASETGYSKREIYQAVLNL